jgi:AraC-like DNA-binding protein
MAENAAKSDYGRLLLRSNRPLIWLGVHRGDVDVTELASRRPPTVTGFAAKCAIAVLQEHNIAAQPLLRRAGLPDHAFDGQGGRVSAVGQANFLEYVADAMRDTAFGLHLAESANPREAGLLHYAVSAAGHLGEAIALLARYCQIVNESVRLKLARQAEGVVIDINYVGISRRRLRQNSEFGIAVIVKAFRENTGHDIRPTRVAFAHARTTDVREFKRFFGCPVEFGALPDQLEFSNEALALPLLTEDPHLLEVLRPFCDEAARARNTAIGSMRALVETEVQRLLPHGKAQAERIAKALAVSVRTLSRRLSTEGTTFAEVVDHLRRSLALEYIKEPGFTPAHIAWLLGYEGSSSFNHAFKRWTGLSPSAARVESRLPAPVG